MVAEKLSSALHGATVADTLMVWPSSAPTVGDVKVNVRLYVAPITSRSASAANVAAPLAKRTVNGPLSPDGTELDGGCAGPCALKLTSRSGQACTACAYKS